MNDSSFSNYLNYFEIFPRETLIKIHDFIVSKDYQPYTMFFISGRHLLSDYFSSLPVEQFKIPSFWEDEACISIFEDLPTEFSKLLEKIQRNIVQESLETFRTLKDYLQIPLTCEIGELDFKSFYTPKAAGFSSVRDIGATIIAPDTVLHAIPKDERIATHDSLFGIMIKNLYDIGGPDIYDEETRRKTEEILSAYRADLITIRHISNTSNLFTVIRIPTYITSFQFEELQKLNAILKQLNVKVHNSYTGSFSLSSEFPTLEEVLEHIKINGCIKEKIIPLTRRTDLPFHNHI